MKKQVAETRGNDGFNYFSLLILGVLAVEIYSPIGRGLILPVPRLLEFSLF